MFWTAVFELVTVCLHHIHYLQLQLWPAPATPSLVGWSVSLQRYYLATVGPGDVAACHCVTLEGELIASVGSEGSGPLHFHTPFAIANCETNSRVYVCDTVNNRVTILNSDLSLYGSFGSKGREATCLRG